MLFRTGQKIICINDNFKWAKRRWPELEYPKFGGVYVMRAYVLIAKKSILVVREITNREIRYTDGHIREAGFWEGRFVGKFDSQLKEVQEIKENA